MVAVLKIILSVLTSFACLFSSMIFGDFAGPYEPKKDDCKMTFAAISDTHIMEYTEEYYRISFLEMGFYDMENAETPLDALVIPGDITNNGKAVQYEKVEKSFSKFNPAKNIIPAVGNHDMWARDIENEDERPAVATERFIEFNKNVAGRVIENTYYTQNVNGYTFIVIGSEGSLEDDPVISDAQLAWLDAELAKATEGGKPVFVVSHWPFVGAHGLPNTWNGEPADKVIPDLDPATGGMGDRNDEVFEIMNKYKNVIMINGHLHNGIVVSEEDTEYGYATIEKYGNVYSVNLPTYHTITNRGKSAMGMGLVGEVYDGEIILRARSFTGGVWYTDCEFSIPLEK